MGNLQLWTEGIGEEEENHIQPSFVRGEAWFLCHRLPCGVGSKIYHLERALQHLSSCVRVRCVDCCGRMQDSGLEEEEWAVRLGSIEIGCSCV